MQSSTPMVFSELPGRQRAHIDRESGRLSVSELPGRQRAQADGPDTPSQFLSCLGGSEQEVMLLCAC